MTSHARCCIAVLILGLLAWPTAAEDTQFDAPHKVAAAFMDALAAKNGDQAVACLLKGEREKSAPGFKRHPPGDLTYELGSTRLAGDIATVDVRGTRKVGEKSEVTNLALHCSLEGGGWWISWQKTTDASKNSGRDPARQQFNMRATLGAIKDRCLMMLAKSGSLPHSLKDAGLQDESSIEVAGWRMEPAFRVSPDGKKLVLEAVRIDFEDVLLLQVDTVSEKYAYFEAVQGASADSLKAQAESLLNTLRDHIRVQFQKLGAMPTNIVGDGKTLTAFNLVNSQWIARNEFKVKGNVVQLVADSITPSFVATLEFDVTKGSGEVKVAKAYENTDQWEKARSDMNAMVKALYAYERAHADYPDVLDSIAEYFPGSKLPSDPFSQQSYAYEKGGSEKKTYVKVTCFGRDGELGGRWSVDRDIEFIIEFTPKKK